MIRRALAVVLLTLPIACGGATATPSTLATASPPPPASAGPTAAPSAAVTPRPSPTVEPTAGQPTTFTSTVYPYEITLPAGTLLRNWNPARLPWDGESPINRTSPRVDVTGTKLGALLVWGLPSADLDAFGERVRDITSRYNGCKLTSEPAPIEVNGVAGVTFAQLCALGTTARTVVVVKDGYGLAFRVVEYSAPDAEVLARLREWAAGATFPVSR
jgi:hypothetical protein